MERLQIMLPRKTKKELDELSEYTGLSKAEIVRRVLDEYLGEYFDRFNSRFEKKSNGGRE